MKFKASESEKHGLNGEIDVKETSYLWTIPELKKPDREPDFTINIDTKKYGTHSSKYWMHERVMEFSDDQGCDSEMIRFIFDERYGIFCDISNTQKSQEWETQCKYTKDAYAQWRIEQDLLGD